jgi:glycine cleavage system aminomethyltransferase T
VRTLALRLSYAGELGWEVYVPAEYGAALWDTLWEAGQDLGVVAAGGAAFDSLRLEKGYRLCGQDIHAEYNPYEAGLGFAVALDKGEFIGREALTRIKERGVQRRLRCLTLDDPAVVVMGKEPILDGQRLLGHVTSANYGYSVRQSIAYGYLPIEYGRPGTRVEIQFFGERHPATVAREPLFDPRGNRLRS